MEENSFTLHRRAMQAMLSLPEAERNNILRAIESVSVLPPSEWPASTVKRLNMPEPHYLLKATPEFRVIFQPKEGGGIEILDVANREAIQAFAANRPK